MHCYSAKIVKNCTSIVQTLVGNPNMDSIIHIYLAEKLEF